MKRIHVNCWKTSIKYNFIFSTGPRMTKSRAAPDVHSEDAFPTLSASKTVEVVGAWGKK